MLRMLVQLWDGEQGAVLSMELALIIATMLLAAETGLVVGLQALTDGVNDKLIDLGSAIGSLNVGYSVGGVQTCHASFASSSYRSSRHVFGAQRSFGGDNYLAPALMYQEALVVVTAADGDSSAATARAETCDPQPAVQLEIETESATCAAADR
jgi:hypothetical protein